MLSTYDVCVSAFTYGEGVARTYRVVARDAQSARDRAFRMAQFELSDKVPGSAYLGGSLFWQRHRGPYMAAQGVHHLEVRQYLARHGSVGDDRYRNKAFIRAIDKAAGRVTVRVPMVHASGFVDTRDHVLTWDEFRAAWDVIPGDYA